MIKKNMIVIIVVLLLATAALCGFFFVREYSTAQEEMSEYAAVQEEYTSVEVLPIQIPGQDPADTFGLSETAGLSYVTADFDALLRQNPETVGWLAIPGTVISYPVVQAKDNTKYLNRSFQGKRSGAGTPFADKDNNMRELDANTILYGHNMGTGRQDMFSSLLSYKDQDYYEAHRFIQFDTIYERHGWWMVFAVIEHDIRSQKFNYLRVQFQDEQDFSNWIASAKELSIYDSGTDVSSRDRVLTLSTCDRSKVGRNGRLLILAVKID